ncbi:MAG: hypothetical protein GXY48_01085 [Methanomicrobiales archaeon]|nr:hypothetical protein [Methanomicrobiales archaeon]
MQADMPHAITTVASVGTSVPTGLQTWITYQTHQPHQTAQGSPETTRLRLCHSYSGNYHHSHPP